MPISILILFLLFSVGVFSEEEFVASTPQEVASINDHLIYGVISPISGQPSLQEIDLEAKGAQNIVLAHILHH